MENGGTLATVRHKVETTVRGLLGLNDGATAAAKPKSRLRTFLFHLSIWVHVLMFAFLTIPDRLNTGVVILKPPPEATGVLTPNNLLTYGEKIYVDAVIGPESMAFDGGHIYTGGSEGYVTDLYKGTARKIVRFGKGICGDLYAEQTCGRPLGMRLDKDGSLLVIDTYHGLFRVNKETGEYQTLYNSSTPIEGQTGTLLNDLDIGPDGKIYFTDSHDMYRRNQYIWVYLEMRACGRLLVYDPKTGKTEKLLDNLVFPNGVQMTSDKQGLLIGESLLARIIRYDLKTREVTVWADNLPGNTDNIRYSNVTGTYWSGMIGFRSKYPAGNRMGPRPWFRKHILGRIVSNDIMETLLVSSRGNAVGLNYGMVAEFDLNGNILRTLHDPEGEVVKTASEMHVEGDYLYISSVRSNYITKLNLNKVKAASMK